MALPTAPLVAAGLVGGFAVARRTGRRQLGGAVVAAAGVACARTWVRRAGPARGAALAGLYAAGMGASHPLARRIGAWPSVLAVTAAASGAAWAVADRRG